VLVVLPSSIGIRSGHAGKENFEFSTGKLRWMYSEAVIDKAKDEEGKGLDHLTFLIIAQPEVGNEMAVRINIER
jgi:hypothetical protein